MCLMAHETLPALYLGQEWLCLCWVQRRAVGIKRILLFHKSRFQALCRRLILGTVFQAKPQHGRLLHQFIVNSRYINVLDEMLEHLLSTLGV